MSDNILDDFFGADFKPPAGSSLHGPAKWVVVTRERVTCQNCNNILNPEPINCQFSDGHVLWQQGAQVKDLFVPGLEIKHVVEELSCDVCLNCLIFLEQQCAADPPQT